MNTNPGKKTKKGIAAIEVMVVVLILFTAFTIAVPLFFNKSDVNRENLTREKLNRIKEAIIGSPLKREKETRTAFGFVGDLGVLPSSLTQLMVRGSYPIYNLDPTTQVLWFGWRGPYLDNTQDNNGAYVALTDSWGNAFHYQNATFPYLIYSIGPDGTDNNGTGDDIAIRIEDSEWRCYTRGDFQERDHLTYLTNETALTIYYPNGTNTIASVTYTPQSGSVYPAPLAGSYQYDSSLDTSNPAGVTRIPIGVRYMTTAVNNFQKIVTIDGGTQDLTNFYLDSIAPPPSTMFELSFDPTDDTVNNHMTTILSPSGGSWINDGLGNYIATGPTGEYRTYFAVPAGDDYRIEVDATLKQGRGYGIYYRSNGQSAVSAYSFQYDPGLASGSYTMAFVVRKVFNGSEQSPFQQVNMTSSQFPNIFNRSHHISITVRGNLHIIKVDGTQIMRFTDSSFLTGGAGLRSWDGSGYTLFHHIIAYGIPPLSTGEFVWWSFEEGNTDDRVYGSGFEIDADEINGTLTNMPNITRDTAVDSTYIHGQPLYSNHTTGYVDFGNVLDITPTDTFSISAWVKLPSINTSNTYTIISKFHKGNRRGWSLQLSQPAGQTNFGALFTLAQGNNRELSVFNRTALTTGTWYHIVMVYDGHLYSGNTEIPITAVTIYVTSLGSSHVSPSPLMTGIETGLRAGSTTTQNSPMRMGNISTNDDYFNGWIDEIKIYFKALTYAEVEDLYQKK